MLAAIAAFALAITGNASALFYDQDVTNAVIFGSGVDNGSFTVDQAGDLVPAFRALDKSHAIPRPIIVHYCQLPQAWIHLYHLLLPASHRVSHEGRLDRSLW